MKKFFITILVLLRKNSKIIGTLFVQYEETNRMKNALFFLILLFLLSACKTKAIEPKFQKIENIVVTDLKATNVTITADAIIYNPNPVSIFLNTVELDVFANELNVGHLKQTKQTEIAKKDNFNIPVAVSFNPTALFQDNLMGLLEAALSSYQGEKIELKFIGYAQFELKGVKFTVPIKYEDKILLKEE
jgi:LEA14-like dessication related protein